MPTAAAVAARASEQADGAARRRAGPSFGKIRRFVLGGSFYCFTSVVVLIRFSRWVMYTKCA